MACNCGKKKLATQPKKIVKTQPKSNTGSTNATKRIIRRAAR